jgi:glycosyltransferase involved in cell wall biosynthesis
MKKAAIVYSQFYRMDGIQRAIGGVETYLINLARLLKQLGYEVCLFQPAEKSFRREIEEMTVIGIPQLKIDCRELFYHAINFVRKEDGLLIFGGDQISVKTNYKKSINIMHGIAWDLPATYIAKMGGRFSLVGKIPFIGNLISKLYFGRYRLKQLANAEYAVLVDYNSVNWCRTQLTDGLQQAYRVILNFVEMPAEYTPSFSRHDEGPIKIIFARRFEKYRGTDLMITAIGRLLALRNDVEIIFAGEGSESNAISKAFENDGRVRITSYRPEESLSLHESCHIAVVPSIASEGSSLSLAEAMGAGCSVIATDVGGMTNMVINNFNGVLIRPTADDLLAALLYLIDNREERKKMAIAAHETAISAFSHSKWVRDWCEVIREVESNPVSLEGK